MSGPRSPRAFRIVPEGVPGWGVGGTAHLDPGVYATSILLPEGAALEYVEVAPPCVNPVEPAGGWQAAGITTAEDLAVTALRALDREDALAPAASPLEHEAADFQTDATEIPAAPLQGVVKLAFPWRARAAMSRPPSR